MLARIGSGATRKIKFETGLSSSTDDDLQCAQRYGRGTTRSGLTQFDSQLTEVRNIVLLTYLAVQSREPEWGNPQRI